MTQMEAGKHVDILQFLYQLCLFGVFSVTILFLNFKKVCDEWSLSGSGNSATYMSHILYHYLHENFPSRQINHKIVPVNILGYTILSNCSVL